MGKIKQKRLRRSRYSPTHIISKSKTSENEADDLNASHEIHQQVSAEANGFDIRNGSGEANLPLSGKGGLRTAKEKISSIVPEEKVTGLNMLAAFALEANAAQSILEDKMAISVAQLLNDKSSQVRLAAVGTLKNLCSWGSDEFIEMIMQQDVMKPLSQLLKSYENNTPSETPATAFSLTYSKGVANSMEESDPHNLTFIHATNVLWSLCECNEDAVILFNRENLVSILLKHINPFVWSYPISLAAADCLLCVSENNPKILSVILPLAPTLLTLITKVMSSEYDPRGLHFVVVIAGVLLNIGYWVPGGDANFHQISEILSKALDTDVGSLLQTKLSNSKHSVQENFEHIVSAQLIAYEILSNICCSEEDEEYEDVSDDNEMMGFDECEPMDMENQSSCNDVLDSVPVEVLESIKYFNLVAKTQNKIFEPEPVTFWNSEEESKNLLLERLKQVKIRSLQCFQNLVACLPVDDLGGADNIYSVWLRLGQISFANSEMDTSLLDALSGALRAIIEKLSEVKYEKLSNITDNDLQPIYSCILCCESHSVKANLCRMIGTLGMSVVKQSNEKVICSSQCSSLIGSIANSLCKVGQKEDSLYVQAESIDVLIDLFSDDKTDKIAAQIRLVETLKEIHPLFKAKFNQQKKRLGEHRPLLNTVKDNLFNFIKYKSSRTLKYTKMLDC